MTDENQGDSSRGELLDEWMIKPCKMYKEEYKDCKKIVSRFNQYYVYGQLLDCNHWIHDYNNCCKFTEKGDTAAGMKLIENEKARVNRRVQLSAANDVWQYRTSPPKDWNEGTVTVTETRIDKALNEQSVLKKKQEEGKSSWEMCVIS